MRFNPKARLDNSRVQDGGSRGGGLGGGLGGSLGGALGGGGAGGGLPMGKGGMGLVVIVLMVVLAMCTGAGQSLMPGSGGDDDPGATGDRYGKCQSGADANSSPECARVAVIQSMDGYWAKTLADQTDTTFRKPTVKTFTGATSTGCGQGSSAMGPFYCPTDQTIYEDTAFYEAVFEGQLGGSNEDFVEPYVLAHEYGHHISHLRNLLGQGGYSQTGPGSKAVRTELLADCYAGLWAQGAATTPDSNGDILIAEIDSSDMEEALDAAKTVGDDYIQKKSGARVDDESWTHGSSAQRQKWFKVGYTTGKVAQCDRVLELGASQI